MNGWSVLIEADGSDTIGDAEVETLLDALAAYAPVVSYGRGSLSIRLTVEADSVRHAIDNALDVVTSSPSVNVASIVRVEAQTDESLGQELGIDDVPDLIGVAELANLLNISKQRASELARQPDFPAPRDVLAAGPIWSRATVLRYARTWKRQPGRPRTAKSGFRTVIKSPRQQ